MKKKITISVTVIALATILIAPKTITKGNASNKPIDHVTPPTITLATDKEKNIKQNNEKKDLNENKKEIPKENINKKISMKHKIKKSKPTKKTNQNLMIQNQPQRLQHQNQK